MDYNVTNDIHPKLNGFDLSHNHFTTMSQGWLYPVAWLECLPGDIHRLDMQALVRVTPMVSPIMNNLTCDLHAFFVPTRLLWDKWEDFITTIDQKSIPPKTFNGQPPVWCENENAANWSLPGIYLHQDPSDLDASGPALWEYFGFSQKFSGNALKEQRPLDFLRRAYYFIWNEWFRDENLQEKVDFKYTDYDANGNTSGNLQSCKRRAWKKDYFTAGFYARQKGTAPSIPLTGTGTAVFTGPVTADMSPFDTNVNYYIGSTSVVAGNNPFFRDAKIGYITEHVDTTGRNALWTTKTSGTTVEGPFKVDNVTNTVNTVGSANFINWLNSNTIDLTNVGTFDVNDLRDLFAIQKFLERLMLSGSRYIEFLQSQFGVSPSDSRLQIPERIGGTSFNINISEVIQTSSTVNDSPQGNQAGHGLSVSAGTLGSYKCEEFGYIIVLANIQPPAVYTDRMPRSMYRKTLLEQYNPHFVNLSFQAVYNREIYADGTTNDNEIFNYSGRYDELRECTSYVTGQLYDRGQDSYSYPGYLQYRSFAKAPGFNSDFIQSNPSVEPWYVQDEDQFLCNFYWNFKSLRPLPLISEPGLIDHVYGGK